MNNFCFTNGSEFLIVILAGKLLCGNSLSAVTMQLIIVHNRRSHESQTWGGNITPHYSHTPKIAALPHPAFCAVPLVNGVRGGLDGA